MMVGQFEVTALYDGYIDLDPKLFKYTSAREVQRLLARMFVESTPGMQTAVNAYLVNTGSHLILVDTGASACFGPTLGRIRENLHAAGYEPEQVDTILLTHLHADHACGLPVQWHGGVSRRHCLCRQGRRGLLARRVERPRQPQGCAGSVCHGTRRGGAVPGGRPVPHVQCQCRRR
jgi:glyoxylase-like metal-dependent hydrolase (beta-lactamase superfamily II)